MHRNSINQDNQRVGGDGYRQMNRGYDHDQHQSGYRGSDDRSHQSYGYDDRGFSSNYGQQGQSGGYERHPHDEHERGRWGQDYSDRGGHRYSGGMIDDNDRFRRDEASFQRSGYQSHGMYDRNRMSRDEYQRAHSYQDRDDRGRFNDTGEGRSYGHGYTGGYDQDYDRNFEHRDRGRFGGSDSRARGGFESTGYDRNDYGRNDYGRSDHGRNDYATDDNRRYGRPSYGYQDDRSYGRGGYGRDDRRFDEQRGYGGSMASDRFGRNDNDSDRRWSGGGYEEDRRGRGRGRY